MLAWRVLNLDIVPGPCRGTSCSYFLCSRRKRLILRNWSYVNKCDFRGLFVLRGFSLALIVGFALGVLGFAKLGRTVGHCLQRSNSMVFTSDFSRRIIIMIFILSAVSLITPVFRLHLLLNPPVPDIVTWFTARFETQPTNLISSLARYLTLLITPFFTSRYTSIESTWSCRLHSVFVALHAVRQGWLLGKIPHTYKPAILGFLSWYEKRDLRWILIAGLILIIPATSVIFSVYSDIRNFGEVSTTSALASMSRLLTEESSLLPNYGTVVIQSEERANLLSFAYWVVTIPYPDF